MSGEITCIGVIAPPCKCEKPDFDVWKKTKPCSVCPQTQIIIEAVFCKKCGGRVSPGRIPKEIQKMERVCDHSGLDPRVIQMAAKPIEWFQQWDH